MLLNQDDLEACATEAQIQDRLRWVVQRLNAMGFEGDCAYERALIREYEKVVDQLNESLERLRAAAV